LIITTAVGIVSGIVQVGRGVLAAPEAAMAPRQGKWWNANEHKWTLTDMTREIQSLAGAPDDDADLLGDLDNDTKGDAKDQKHTGEVKDKYYYDALEIRPDCDQATIRKHYYMLARKYHPDKHPNDAAALEKFKAAAEAYQVLSDETLRNRYDKEGKEGLSADKTSVVGNDGPKIDADLMFAFLFGSDKFYDYVGRLATATSFAVGNTEKVAVKDAQLLQHRRCVRLAIKLIDKVQDHVDAQADGAPVQTMQDKWLAEAIELSNACYGYQLVTTIGKVRTMLSSIFCFAL
jgi:hypothetical protein